MQPIIAPIEPTTNTYRVEGRIFFDHGLPADAVTVRLYHRGFGGDDVLLGETSTDAKGFYLLPYTLPGKAANLEVRSVDAAGAEISLSATKYNAEAHEVLNLVVPQRVRPLAPEYERLAADLSKELGDFSRIAGARERAARQDLTLLHQATGWDARLIALAATTAKLSRVTRMAPEVLYALARVGLPTDPQRLAYVSSEVMEQALQKAQDAGIVRLKPEQIDQARAAFQRFARSTRLNATAPGALSSFSDLLRRAGANAEEALTDDEQQTFASVYFAQRGAAAELWQQAEAQGISRAKIDALRLQGKLAFLTLNNAPLTQNLQQEIGTPDNLAQLVDKDFHQSDPWKTRLTEMAGGDERALEQLIPPEYTGKTVAARLDAYAADLAQKVRMSFPTRIVGRMVEQGKLGLGDGNDELKSSLVAFLRHAEGLGFQIGRMPVGTFIREQNLTVDEATIQAAKLMHRLYQISPSDEALELVSRKGLTSAQDILAYSYEGFLERYGDEFPTREEAQMVHRRAQQVGAVTQNLVLMAKQMETAPVMYALSPPPERMLTKDNLIKRYPTLKSLFDSLDFCECEHCRSVLSPAAYLVDLLHFLDPGPDVWASTAPTPFQALTERRLDLPELPLTCENTNTMLPYIDLVNEILEYYVDYGKLDEKAVHDTGEATTPELLAEPQNIIAKAYDTLKNARYPLTLPFDLWLETVRRFFDHFETPLWQVLEVFRPTDELFPPRRQPKIPKNYYRAAIFTEYLGISPSEVALFTDTAALAKWHELYGFDTPQDALTALKSAKTLAHRLGVSYKELIDLVCTDFVNPHLDELIVFRKLGLDADDVFRYKDLPPYRDLNAVQKAAFDVRFNDLKGKISFNQILFLADPPNTGCDFDQTPLCYANADPADELVFLKINLFVRLWKKLGWTMEETDRALQVFLPNSLPLTAANLGAALKVALVYLAHLKALDMRVEAGKNSRLKLLTLWSNLSTTGKNPLYGQLFLTPSVLKNDAVFDDPLGNYLATPDILISDHLLALQGALVLTADEIGRILADADPNLSVDTAKLLLGTVSLLYRYGLLAKALKLSVRDLITLKQLSGLDPFKPLADPLTTIEQDYPFSQTLRFVEVAKTIQASGLTIEDLEYLLRHRFAESGKYRPNQAGTLGLLKTVAEGVRAIRADHALPADPGAISDDTLRQKLGLALPSEVVERLLSMMNGTAEFTATKANVAPLDQLRLATFADALAIRGVSYKEVPHKEQKLTLRGLLFDQEKEILKGKYPSVVFASLLDDIQEQQKAFFKKQVQVFFDDYVQLFTNIPDKLADPEIQVKLVWALNSSLTGPDLLADDFLILHDNLKSVLPADVATTFLQMLRGEIEYVAVQQAVELADALPVIPAPELTITYDQTAKKQTVTCTGVLTDARSAALKQLYHAPLFATLLDDVQQQAKAFYQANLQDFFASADFDLFFSPDNLGEKRAGLRRAFLFSIMLVRPALLTEDVLRQSLNDRFSADVSTTFLAMLQGQAVYVAVQPAVELADALPLITEPELTISYDGTLKQQTLTYTGVLTDARSIALKQRYPWPLFAALLDAVQQQAKAFYADKLLAVFTGGSFSLLFQAVPQGLNDTLKQTIIRWRRARLAQAFLPFLQQRLIRQFIVQTMTAHTGADPALVEALLTDTRLLGDPQPLLAAFIATGERGMSANFFDSVDGSGAPQAIMPVILSADTALKNTKDTNGNLLNPANSARFEGYLEVPAPAAYRFYAALDKQDAEAELRFPDLPKPVVFTGKAAQDQDELGNGQKEFVELKPGILYRVSLDVKKLNGGEAHLLVQGETLPKGSLAQLTLYPLTIIEHGERALLLLTKTLQLIQSLGLAEREVRHLLTHKADFDNLSLSALPTSKTGDTPGELAAATVLFGHVLRLATYANLKHGPAGGTDDLISVFAKARYTHPETASEQAKTAHFEPVAQLTGRDPATVRATAEGLGFTIEAKPDGTGWHVETLDLAQEKGCGRLWEALQIVEKLGVPPKTVIDATSIIATALRPPDRFDIARTLRNTVKARYEAEDWQHIAQPIFDKLRQCQRDALVAYIMHQEKFERVEQLFEYFLIDPGMEPVVQTSRLRLAISSVQLFIQRCLLNLEKQVKPSAINTAHWQWMKRYRLWEANRKLYLFPENWLEPEFRDDKTHLYEELESALLQGDVSNDLAAAAFFQYLKKLEELARLDIVTMYCEEKPDPALNILHVIGRTYNLPHKYFYRRYANHLWTPWEPVTAEVGGDHVVAVVWRQRLHLFWVTFLEQAKQDTSGIVKIIDPFDYTPLPTTKVQLLLNWSEYFQGQWTTLKSSDVGNSTPVDVGYNFNSRDVLIRATKEYSYSEEGAVRIHLDFGLIGARVFQLISKNSPPEFLEGGELLQRASNNVWKAAESDPEIKALQEDLIRQLLAFFQGGEAKQSKDLDALLRNFYFEAGQQKPHLRGLFTNILMELAIREKPPYSFTTSQANRYLGFGEFQVTLDERTEADGSEQPNTTEPSRTVLKEGAVYSLVLCANRLLRLLGTENGALLSPLFYQDNEHTFFVEPALVNVPFDLYGGFGLVGVTLKGAEVDLNNVPVGVLIPMLEPLTLIDLRANFELQNKTDWLTEVGLVIPFDEQLVAEGGGLDFAVLPAGAGAGDVSRLAGSDRHLRMIDGAGLNSVVVENLNIRRDVNFTPDLPSDGPIGRPINR